ncbi:magnesium transporter [Nocardioides luteus]|uniref:Magnesium transport protein CorA n=1 Tax=Nocardioides luteus TaxID=1844 RepID=A0ABQ5T084_9ACTN|nr:magnesium/cobalt transporter CorA [Nocardioides luteus]MDR7310369.1 magnesium transporter [Nocardioides luteus]GGR53201.1 magnesium transport protein CorA [Nocardioides luteus]GLJ69852.1 magnesium transport protein CorA [Nocardioides luteus]
MIVDSALYRAGERDQADSAPRDYAALRAGVRAEGDFVWLGLYQPSQGELDEVADAFGLHPLAVEDALKAHQRPKLERYGDGMFLVVKTLWYVDADDAVETGEVAFFIGADYVITVRHGRGSQLAPARELLETSDDHLLTEGPYSAVHSVVDYIVDGYRDVATELTKDVDEVETSVFSDERTEDSARIYRLRREIAEMRRAVMPLREPVRRFANGEAGIDPDLRPYFRDILDHLSSIVEAIENLETLLSSAFQAHMAQLSLQQNEDMRRISAGAALVVVPTLIAGIYGMNFTHMPELSWTFGYPFSLLLMAAVVAGLWIFFRKSGWF